MLKKHDKAGLDQYRYFTENIFKGVNAQLEGNVFLPDQFPGKKTFILTDRPGLKIFEKDLGPLITSLDGFSDEEISNCVFYIYFNHDCDALSHLKRIKTFGGIFVPPVLTGKIEYHYANKWAFEALCATERKKDRISHVNINVWSNIAEALDITKNLEGDYVEIGVYLGGSALLAMNCIEFMRQDNAIKERKMVLIDTFDGFNYEEAQTSVDQIWKNTHKLYGVKATMDHIHETFKDNSISYLLLEGNICKDNLPDDVEKIVVANIDVDMYEPTLDALNKVTDLIVSGGIIICEDAASTPGLYGGYLAMEEFIESEKGQSYTKIFKGSQYFLLKKQ
jgi:hypothetical protein